MKTVQISCEEMARFIYENDPTYKGITWADENWQECLESAQRMLAAEELVKAAKAAQRLICPEHCGGGYHDRECEQLSLALALAEKGDDHAD